MLDVLRSKKVAVFAIVIALVAALFLINVSSQDQNTAPIAKAKADVVSGLAPLMVQFNSTESSDPDGDDLTFAWEFGDGTKSSSANPTKSFDKSGKYSVVLRVNDGEQIVAATPIVITVSDAAVQGAATEAPTKTNREVVLGASVTSSNRVIPTTNPPTTIIPATPEPNPNLIPNASFVDPYSDDTPLFWIKGGYGLNVIEFIYEKTGRTDESSVSVTMSENIFGDAKWIFEPVAIEGGKSYQFKDWYKSDVQTQILVDYTLEDSSHLYELVDIIPPAADWTEYSKVLVTPENTTEISVHHVINSDGTLQLDDFSLVEQ